MIQTHHQLFGPAQAQGALVTIGGNGQQWLFPGSALTASTKPFYFQFGLNVARHVRWLVVWTGNNIFNRLRLVHFDDGPQNIVEMGQLGSDGAQAPRPLALDVTDSFNKLVLGGAKKNIGFQVSHITSFILYESRLEIVWT